MSLVGLSLAEAMDCFAYLKAVHRMELRELEQSPYAQVTVRMLTYEEWQKA